MIFDIEGDGLVPTKIYCLCYYDEVTKSSGSITDYEEMKTVLLSSEKLIGHKIITFDIPVLERILNIDLSKKDVIDTLGLSWYLYQDRKKHGLEHWGVELGVEKPVIKDWINLSIDEYIKRCEEDVKINTLLYFKQLEYLNKLYKNTKSILKYIRFKLECAREAEEIRWKLDIEKTEANLRYFTEESDKRLSALSLAMPPNVKYRTLKKPSNLYKKDGSLSIAGVSWLDNLMLQNKDFETTESLQIVQSEELGNPNSNTQMKSWLYSLGWIPKTYKANEKNEQVAQIYTADKQVCESVKLLYENNPVLTNLDSLSVISHKIGLLEGFLKCQENGYVRARVSGFTNTMRFKHSEIVNLPKAFEEQDKRKRSYMDGVYIRECLSCEDDELLCGSDMSALEDTTKQHYIYKYDPDYVTQMRTPGFDPHLEIAVLANMMTPEEAEEHKLYDKTEGKEGKSHKATRYLAKTTNFSATYGVGVDKLMSASGMNRERATNLLKTYWKRNKAIILVANSFNTKRIDDQTWLLNPVSKFWYPLRYEKDRFSTGNQGLASFCFDCYVKEIRKKYKVCAQFHDEVVIPIKNHQKEELKQYLTKCIEKVNTNLGLNVPLGISMDFGKNYAQIH